VSFDPYQPPTAPIGQPFQSASASTCPKCGSQSATKVGFNWWGGALGPRLFHVVKCSQCGTQYNGKTGGTLTKVIIIYQGVILLVTLLVLFLVWMFAPG
jgi:uncharacterized protein (DUF983 family)